MQKMMIRCFMAFAVLFAAVTPLSVAEANAFRTVERVTIDVDVHAQPSYNAKIVGEIPAGTIITVLSDNGTWAHVQWKSISGYIPSAYFYEVPFTIKIASSKGGLVVKQLPSKNSPTLATLSYNMIVKDYGPDVAGWSFVQYGNVTGYVATSFIHVPTSKKMVVSASQTIVRNIASPSGANIGTFARGTEVNVYATLAGWSYVKSGVVEGYVTAASLAAKTAPKATKPAPQTVTQKPAAKPAAPAKQTSGFKNCTELKKVYPNGVMIGHPAYESKHDRDKDGHACEPY